jgi:hypothetical protein
MEIILKYELAEVERAYIEFYHNSRTSLILLCVVLLLDL